MSDSRVVRKGPCPACGSRDNLAYYDDGHAFCFGFGCGHYIPGDGSAPSPSSFERKERMADLIDGEFKALSKRGITEETARKFGYRVGSYGGKTVQIAPYYKGRELVSQHIRFPDKDFLWLGDSKGVELFGQHLWGQGGKKLVITEGEIDAMSVSQIQGNKWPVVSIPSGVSRAVKDIQANLEWLETFEEVILMLDMDEPGQKAAVACAELLSPGKAKIATLPLKDANECLQAGKADAVIQAIWNAKTYRPDGIVSGSDLWTQILTEETASSIPYPWASLNLKTHGLRQAELVTVTAGSGVGKSAVVRETAYHLLKQGERVGMIMLEESTKRTALGLMGLELNRPIHINREGVTEDELRSAFQATVGSGSLYLYDHFGSTEIDNLLSRVRYMAKALGCRWVILDHLSIVVSGLGDGDERRLIDNAMTMLRTLVQETGIGLILVSHLKRPEGKGHEEGAKTSLAQLRGSAAIAQLSDIVIGLERDQQGEDPNVTTIRVLKNRFSGETGEACQLRYNPHTGRLHEWEAEDEEHEQDEFA